MFDLWKRRLASKASLARILLPRDAFYFRRSGHCPCCEKPAIFIATDPWLRDHFRCCNCGSIPRQRALLRVIEAYYPGWRSLAIHESSPDEGGASSRLAADCSHYLASHYFPAHPLGSTIAGFRNEDLARQTFPDNSFDLVITQDVLEHVYEPQLVFREIARTLRPGGAHICTVPLVNKHRASEVWAVKGAEGEPKFLYSPEYHGNPVDANGAPVTMHWGYDIGHHIWEASGLETTIEHLDDLHFGIRGEYIEVLVSRKP